MSARLSSKKIAALRKRLRLERARHLRKRRGVALILVLGALVILTVFVTQLQEQTSAALSTALAERDSLKAEYNARSAVNLSRLLIATEPGIRRVVGPIIKMLGVKGAFQIPVWNFTDLVLGPFNDAEGAATFNKSSGADASTGKNLGLTGGHYELHIVDEDSKINANAVVAGDPFTRNRFGAQFLGLVGPVQYNPIFEKNDQDGQISDRATICGAIVDYVDLDETFFNCDVTGNASQSGDTAEDNFYQSMGLPYVRKNAALDSFEELRQVRGMSDDFWATFVDPDPEDPTKRVMTVWGQDKINVNSANAQTVLAIVCAGAPDAKVCIDPIQAQNFISGMTLAKAFTMGIPVFTSPKNFTDSMSGKGQVGPILAGLGVDPITFRSAKDVQRSIATESKVFSIYADGVVPGFNRETRVRVHAVVDFRNASELGASSTVDASGTGGAGGAGTAKTTPLPAAAASSSATTSSGSSGSTPTPEQAAADLLSDPMGNMIYYRVE